MIKFKVANDNGNSEQNMFITCDKNVSQVASPNVFARVPRLPNMDDVNEDYLKENIHDNLIVGIDNQLYYVGNQALKSGMHCHSIQVGVNNNKVTSDIVYINTLAHVAGEAIRYTTLETPDVLEDDIIKVQVDMATALPVSYYSKENVVAFCNKFMQKEHTISVYVGTKEYHIFLSFECVQCIPEGVTATYGFLANAPLFQGDSKEPVNVENSRIFHIAIGEGTTEFPLTFNKIHFNRDFNKGTNNGTGHAIASILDDFKKKFGLLSITRQDFSRYIRNMDHKYHEAAMEALYPALMDEAQDILEFAEARISAANNEIDCVAVYGGGSILMKQFLKPKLQEYCDRAKIRLLYIEDATMAVFLEAYGLNAFVCGPYFDSRKKKTQEA